MKSIRFGLTIALLQLCIVSTGAAQAPQIDSSVAQMQAWQAFETFHREILSKRCTTCHSSAHSQMSVKGTALETAQYFLKRGYVVPGSLEQSKVYYRLAGTSWFSSSMPPGGLDRDSVKDREIRAAALALLATWLKAGAPVPAP